MSAAVQELAPVALIPEDAPFSPEQRAWLNGFFLGLLSTPPAGAAAPAATLTILHASQTGTAEGLARKLAKEAKGRGRVAQAQELGSLSVADLASHRQLLIIASTYGEGEPPDAAAGLALALDAAEGRPLAGVQYAVLALGDRNYAQFCRFGIRLDERLAALGATRLIERIDVDGAPDEAFQAWRAQLWPALEGPTAATVPAAQAVLEEAAPDEDVPALGSRDRPFPAKLLGKAVLTASSSDKETRHVVLSLAGSGLAYEPGDALGVWARNPPQTVERAIALSGFAADAPVIAGGAERPLFEVLSAHRELGKLSVPAFKKLAAFAAEAAWQELLAPANAAALAAFLHGRDVLDLLQARLSFPDPQALVDALAPLAPRLYSISSSLAAFPEEVHLTVGVVRYEHLGRRRGGLASTFLADRIEAGEELPVYVHPNNRFRLPRDAGTPLIMIGPGTGIAPFRAFLHERRVRGLTGRTWLFFGDRHATDFLYRDELEDMLRSRCLTQLTTAFSRDQAQKIYVQHRMLEAGRDLWTWLQDGATVYVCGDAANMAKDVDAALQAIFVKHGGLSPAAAQLELRHLSANGRYVRDVY
jgi:sulfite reductase (NADPH) flavoprotein alpha-component